MRFSKLLAYSKIFEKLLKYDRTTTRTCTCASKPPPKAVDDQLDSGKKGLVLGVYENNKQFCLTPAAEEVNKKSGGKLCKHLNQLSGEMKMGRAFVVTDLLPEYSAVALSLLGPKGCAYNELESMDEARENIRWCVGAGVRLLQSRGCGAIDVDTVTAPDAAAEAAELAAWRFHVFKEPNSRKPECLVSPFGKGNDKLWKEGSIRGKAQNWARYLSDMPANRMTPVDLAQAAIDELCPRGVVVRAHDAQWVAAQRMRAFQAVARGSCHEPVFVELEYRGAGPHAAPVLVAAKGVTFDSGGLCLKKCESMSENRGSMAGAAVALGAIKALAELKVPINVCVVLPLCENMVSGQCMKVGDVVQALNGLSIQIEHTDYEGRLMMADALVYGQAIYKPALVIDVATFTLPSGGAGVVGTFGAAAYPCAISTAGGVLMATGGGAFGCFSNSERAWAAARLAGALSGDRPWRFPLWRYYHRQITNDPSVDLRNKGSGHATPCLGAAFLKNFICGEWLHLDITGVGKLAHLAAPPYLDPRRMTGRPTRTLAALLANMAARTELQPAGAPSPTQQTAVKC